MEEKKQESLQQKQQETENAKLKKQWIGRGIYESKDVPIRILDGLIIGAIALIFVLVLWSVKNGSFYITFDTMGGSEIAEQRVKHGKAIEEPEIPFRPGYEFQGWITSSDPYLAEDWDFATDLVEEDMTLYAVWEPAQITVKFDLNGGTVDGQESIDDIRVTFGETYGGQLPVPNKPGYEFDGWEYGGMSIQADTVVTTNGEHVLTARWR